MPDPDIQKDIYRIAVLGNFSPEQESKSKQIVDQNGQRAVSYRKDPDGLFSVKIKQPDGSVECWKQTSVTLDASDGFKAACFERRNEDGSTWLDKDRKPSIVLTFPGNTGTQQDMRTSDALIAGQNMEKYYAKAEKFTENAVTAMQTRAEKFHHDMPQILVGSHSMGAMGALEAGHKLRTGYGLKDVKTVLVEPFGAGQVLEQLALREANTTYNSKPTQDQVKAIAGKISTNVHSVRAEDPTIFEELKMGDERYDNAMVGKTYRYKTDPDDNSLTDGINDHRLLSIANFQNRYGDKAVKRTENKDLTAVQILEGGGLLSQDEKDWAHFKTQVFNTVISIAKLFNEAAAYFLQENSNSKRLGFQGMKLQESPAPASIQKFPQNFNSGVNFYSTQTFNF